MRKNVVVVILNACSLLDRDGINEKSVVDVSSTNNRLSRVIQGRSGHWFVVSRGYWILLVVSWVVFWLPMFLGHAVDCASDRGAYVGVWCITDAEHEV